LTLLKHRTQARRVFVLAESAQNEDRFLSNRIIRIAQERPDRRHHGIARQSLPQALLNQLERGETLKGKRLPEPGYE
jgi:hypothetical protein